MSIQGQMVNEALNFAQPCFEEPPWTTGKLNVIADPITDAIKWLASQLRHEADARKAFQSHVDAELAILKSSPEIAISMDDRIEKVSDSSGDLQGILEKLGRDIQRLQVDQALQKKQQDEKAKGAEGLMNLRLDALSREIQARALQEDVVRQMDALRLEVKDIASSAGQVAAEAALANNVAALHSQLDGVCATLQSQVDSLHDRYGELAKQIDRCEDEISSLRHSPATTNPSTSASTPTGSSVCPDSRDSMTNRLAVEHAESSGANDVNSTNSKMPPLIPEFVMPVWQDRRDDTASKLPINEVMGKAGLVQAGTRSGRPSACSTAGTIGGTDSAHRHSDVLSRDTDSCFGKPMTPDGCTAWVEDRIDELRAEMMELKKLFQQAWDGRMMGQLLENVDRASNTHGADDVRKGEKETQDEHHPSESAMTISEKPCENLHGWLRQNLQELLEQMGYGAMPEKSPPRQNMDVVNSPSQSSSGCELRAGDDKGSSNSQPSAVSEHSSLAREEIVALLRDELNVWMKERHDVNIQERGENGNEKDCTNLQDDLNRCISKSDVDPTLSRITERLEVLESNVSAKDGLGMIDIDGTLSTIQGRLRALETLANGSAKDGIRKIATPRKSDTDATLSSIKERLRALETGGSANGRVVNNAGIADIAVVNEGLRKLVQRVDALENDQSSAALRPKLEDSKRPVRSLTFNGDRKGLVEEDHLDGIEAKREIANLSKAIKGTQRSLDLATSKIEDLSSAQNALKARLDVSLPHFLQALQSIAEHVGLDASQHISAACQDEQSDCAKDRSAKGQEGLNIRALRELINSDMIPQLFVSPDSLRQAVDALGGDLQARLNRLQHDVKDSFKGKADSEELQNLAWKLRELEHTLPSYFAQFDMHQSEEGIENPAGVRWPMQPARCISCNAKADLVAPWEQKTVPKNPWPPRQQWLNSKAMMQNSPPIRARRRDSLPSIDRSPEK
jgi:prefoldin subunit 5